jgi:Fe-S cluster assembly ATP-binding protein
VHETRRRAFTRGDLGLSVPSLYGNVRPIYYYYTFTAVAAGCVLLTHVILRSPVGYFMRAVKDAGRDLHIDSDMLKRALNVGFSGGEKKRAEILQMALLEPKLCVLDETDSGLDIDALKIVADGVNALRSPDRAVVVITHYQRLLDYIVPDTVHVLYKGQVIKSGDKTLAHELEANGYADIIGAAA